MRRALLAGVVALALIGAGAAAAAEASPRSDGVRQHNYPLTSTPADGETLTALPDSFSVTTNEELLDLAGAGNGFAIQVKDAAGAFYGDGCLTVDGSTMSTPAALGAPGAYDLVWQLVSADGHTVSGELAFTWAPEGDVTESTGSPAPAACGQPAPTIAPEAAEAGADAGADGGTDGTGTAAPDPTASDAAWVGIAVLAVVGAAARAAVLTLWRRRRS